MRRQCNGFTLIEVLVALAIVAIGMAAVLEAVSSSANTVLYLRDKTLAEWVGLNEIATTRLSLQPGQIPQTGNTTGDMDYAGRSWHWRQEVTATQVQGIVRIDVKVRPAEVKAGDDNGWFATVSGIAGDSLAAAQGTTPTWGSGNLPGQGNEQCPPGTSGIAGPPGTSGVTGTPGCNTQPQCQPGTQGCNTPQTCQPGTPGCNTQQCQPGTLGCSSQNPTNGGIGAGAGLPAPAPAPSGGLGGDGGLGSDSGLGSGNDGLGSDNSTTNTPGGLGSPNQ